MTRGGKKGERKKKEREKAGGGKRFFSFLGGAGRRGEKKRKKKAVVQGGQSVIPSTKRFTGKQPRQGGKCLSLIVHRPGKRMSIGRGGKKRKKKRETNGQTGPHPEGMTILY